MGTGRNANTGYRARFGGSFGIWSIRFSGDGRELVAGATGGSILVYDIESRRTIHRIYGHDEDVNAVCFADSSSPHILYSGSDDTTLKVWDTRSLGDSREAGAFVGHVEGLTYIDSKGDGRKQMYFKSISPLTFLGYILSNGKDQSMKLWDLRMVMSPRDFHTLKPNRQRATEPHFDYRWGTYDEDDWYEHPNDNSLVTFRGHKVLRTLIRCHFSPPGSTNSRYVYSGSEDGKVYIWNMDATLAGTIDVYNATKNTRPPHREYDMMGAWDDDEDYSHSRWKTCVRDASWHPNAPMIVGMYLFISFQDN
jgi:WD repeat-containing protein 23